VKFGSPPTGERRAADTLGSLVRTDGAVELCAWLPAAHVATLSLKRLHIRPKLSRYRTGPVAAIILVEGHPSERQVAAALLNPALIEDLKLLRELARQSYLRVHLFDETGQYHNTIDVSITPVDRVRLEALLRQAAQAAAAVPPGRRDFARSRTLFARGELP